MSANVTYDITAEDGKGRVIATFPVRTPYTLSTGQCVNLALQAGYSRTTFASARRSIPAKIGRASTTRVSSTVRFL
jgi:hypothetical protein